MAKRDNSGIPNTCPKIDEVLKLINIDDEDELECAKQLEQASEIMENIRTANSDLRDWGNDMCNQRDDLEDENNDLENLLSVARQTIKEQEKQIEDLEYTIRQLEKELDNALLDKY